MQNKKLIGPFIQLIGLHGLPVKGALKNDQLVILRDGGLLVEHGKIISVGNFLELKTEHPDAEIELIEQDMVALPGFVDCHTHVCFAGSRAMDFAARNDGKTYLEIAQEGGGIWSTVKNTRMASQEELVEGMLTRLNRMLAAGVTTVEVKSGYGLSKKHELNMLRAIQRAENQHLIDVVPTCLAAHIKPKDYNGTAADYLDMVIEDLVPVIREEGLCNRFDIFTEQSAFDVPVSLNYLSKLKKLGFQLTVHGDQFTPGGSSVAISVGALSVDHLEASGDAEIEALAASDVIAVALPGASIGLGVPFTAARKLLDQGASVAIASDWNPGSAPQGDLLTQASILSTYEKLSAAEVFAGMTYRAAHALGLYDRGKLESGKIADMVAFPTRDFREILYHQGSMRAVAVWKNGMKIN